MPRLAAALAAVVALAFAKLEEESEVATGAEMLSIELAMFTAEAERVVMLPCAAAIAVVVVSAASCSDDEALLSAVGSRVASTLSILVELLLRFADEVTCGPRVASSVPEALNTELEESERCDI